MAFCAYCGTQVGEVSYRPCAACGSPTNGAPRPVLARGGTNVAAIAIGVVFVGLFAVMILGIVAAIAIPNYLTAQQRAKQIRTIVDIRAFASAVESYAAEHRTYPTARSIDELRTRLEPKHIDKLPASDGWSRPLRYECWPEESCRSYAIASGGKDGTFDETSLAAYSKAETQAPDCDIVYATGAFVVYPKGLAETGSD